MLSLHTVKCDLSETWGTLLYLLYGPTVLDIKLDRLKTCVDKI